MPVLIKKTVFVLRIGAIHSYNMVKGAGPSGTKKARWPWQMPTKRARIFIRMIKTRMAPGIIANLYKGFYQSLLNV